MLYLGTKFASNLHRLCIIHTVIPHFMGTILVPIKSCPSLLLLVIIIEKKCIFNLLLILTCHTQTIISTFNQLQTARTHQDTKKLKRCHVGESGILSVTSLKNKNLCNLLPDARALYLTTGTMVRGPLQRCV